MLTHKNIRSKGKISFSKYFQEFKEGDNVAVAAELSIPFSYSHRLQGRTGKVISKRGSSYYVRILDLGKPKFYVIHPVHLKMIKNL